MRPYYLLDTNIVSELSKPRQNKKVIEKIKEHSTVCAIASISIAELWKGVYFLSEGSNKQLDFLDFINDEILYLYPEIIFDHHAAFIFGKISSYLRKIGKPKSDMDILIAATAIANNLILVTRNTKDFEDIPHLMMENWFLDE